MNAPKLDFKVVIPARYGSSRLPGKPLLPLLGKPMILHVVERALAAGAGEVIVATDDPRIADVVRETGTDTQLTRDDHESGSDRIGEVVRIRGWSQDTCVVNLQGDEPGMPANWIRKVAEALVGSDADLATIAVPLDAAQSYLDPNCVKVVCDRTGRALYFSRAPIPWHREAAPRGELHPGTPYLRHVGLYGYRVHALQTLCRVEKSPLELAEKLEQLRALHQGMHIHVETRREEALCPGVDTPEDLSRVEAWLRDHPTLSASSATPTHTPQ